MLAAIYKRAELPSKALLVGDGLTVFDLLISARSHPVGVALSERASGPRTRTLLELMGVPAIVDVQGLFRWASDGDVALIDADRLDYYHRLERERIHLLLIDDARRGLEDIAAGRTHDADDAIALIQKRRARPGDVAGKGSVKAAPAARKRG